MIRMRLPASRPAVGSSQPGWNQRARPRRNSGVASLSRAVSQVAVDHHRLVHEAAETGQERPHDPVAGDALTGDHAGTHQHHLATLQGPDQDPVVPGRGHEAGHRGVDAQHVGGVAAEHDQRVQLLGYGRGELRLAAEHARGVAVAGGHRRDRVEAQPEGALHRVRGSRAGHLPAHLRPADHQVGDARTKLAQVEVEIVRLKVTELRSRQQPDTLAGQRATLDPGWCMRPSLTSAGATVRPPRAAGQHTRPRGRVVKARRRRVALRTRAAISAFPACRGSRFAATIRA